MASKRQRSMLVTKLATLAAGAVLFFLADAISSYAGESEAAKQKLIASAELPRRPSSVVKFSELVSGGMQLGTVVWYDDPATRRLADYLEVYDSDGGLVALAWFDRYGIERMAMDRAFVEGKERLEGVFVALVDGDLM